MTSARVQELISAERIASRIDELGADIARDHPDGDLLLVGVLRGSFVFLADLARKIDRPVAVDFLGIASYGDATESSGVTRITNDLAGPIAGKDVLLVEDIVDTGLTISYLLDLLRDRGPKSVRVAALLHKPARMKRQVRIDYVGFTIPDEFVVGYGLDYAQQYRNLPYIGVLEMTSATS